MAYPTTIAFKAIGALLGVTQIGLVDSAARHPIGTRMNAVDPVYGTGEFAYLGGVANTAAGDLVVYDEKAGTTTRSVAASRGPVAVATAAIGAGQFGWYQIGGQAVVNTTAAGTGAANSLLQVTATAGQATVSGTASVKIDGAVCKSAQDAPGAGFTNVELARPAANGNT